MTSVLHIVRASIVSLVVGAVVLAVVAFARMPAPTTIVVVPITMPTAAHHHVAVYPAWCAGYWRYSSIDLRPYCGW